MEGSTGISFASTSPPRRINALCADVADRSGQLVDKPELIHADVLSQGSLLDELLPAVDVVSAACKGCIGHNVHGERGYVSRAYDAPDRQRSAELLAAPGMLPSIDRNALQIRTAFSFHRN